MAVLEPRSDRDAAEPHGGGHDGEAARARHVQSVEPRFGAYGWTVDLDRKVLEFATLSRAARDGFTVTGTGRGTVTPPLFQPRALYLVAGRRSARMPAGACARPSSGPADTAQEYTPAAPAGRVTATVKFSRVRR